MTECSVTPFILPLGSPFRSAEMDITERRGFVVTIETAEGVGYGEATPLMGWSEDYDRCELALMNWAHRSVDHPGQIVLPELRAARHGVLLATMDVAARVEAVPLATYLAGDADSHRSVPVHATLGNEGADNTVRAARQAIAEGYKAIKCKVGGRDIDREVDRLTALREAVGDEFDLHLDANRAWTPDEVVSIWPSLEVLDISYVEEPLREPTPEKFAAIDRESVGIGIDETVVARRNSLNAWYPHVDVVVLKPMALGGIDYALDLAIEAIRRDISPVVSGTVDGVVARTAGFHLAAALPTRMPAGLATGSLLEDDLSADPIPIEDGVATLPSRPGLGIRSIEVSIT